MMANLNCRSGMELPGSQKVIAFGIWEILRIHIRPLLKTGLYSWTCEETSSGSCRLGVGTTFEGFGYLAGLLMRLLPNASRKDCKIMRQISRTL